MTTNHSLFDFFVNSGSVVKLVMFILLLFSLISWTFIFQRWFFLGNVRRGIKKFEHKFWSGIDMQQLYLTVEKQRKFSGIETLFATGFKEFNHLHKKSKMNHDNLIQNVRQAMISEQNRLADILELHLPFLATVGSTSPYIGLFGTVWGIMTAFTALGNVQQATISMVAPGISEALIATAMGLLAAIPAVIAYNRFIYRVEQIRNIFDSFQEDFIRVLYHQLYKSE